MRVGARVCVCVCAYVRMYICMYIYICIKSFVPRTTVWQSLLNTVFVQTPANNGKQIAVVLDTEQYSIALFRVITAVYFGNNV